MNLQKTTHGRSPRPEGLLALSLLLAAGAFPSLGQIGPVGEGTSARASEPGLPSVERLYDYEGAWNVNGDLLTFKVEGDKVIGTAPRTRTHIEAILAPDGLSLAAKWREPGNLSGPAVYRLSEDGNRLEGHWRLWRSGNGGTQSWAGHRVGPPSPQSRYHTAPVENNSPEPDNPPVNAESPFLFAAASPAVVPDPAPDSPLQQQAENAPEQAKGQFEGKCQDEGEADTLSKAVSFYTGTAGREDEAKAKELFLQAYEAGGPLAIMWMARLRHKGRCGFPEEPEQAVQLARGVIDEVIRLAEHGDREAMFLYGSALEEGLGIDKNANAAAEWYRKAADQGDAMAMERLGCIHQNSGNNEEAAKWYRKAADQGNAMPMNNLGVIHEESGNKEEAEKWYRKAADQGEALAMNNLGVMYRDRARPHGSDFASSRGRPARPGAATPGGQQAVSDGQQAIFWFRKGAEAGNDLAMYNLACELDMEKRYEQASQWYRKAADGGNASAMCNLGFLYEQGLGVERDYKQALGVISFLRRCV